MKRILKILLFAFLGIIALAILYDFLEPASWKRERRNRAKTYLREVTDDLVRLKAALPELNEDILTTRFDLDSFPNWNEIITISANELNQFADTSLMITNPLPWGPWQDPQVKIFEDTYMTLPKYRNDFIQIDAGGEIQKKKFAAIFSPVYYREPKLIDKKTFMPGYFDGWMVLMDIKKMKRLGYARFKAMTKLKEINGESLGVGLDPIPVGIPLINITDFDEILQKDFKKEFFNIADSIMRTYSGTKSDYRPL